MTLPGYLEAISADWETYSPMPRTAVVRLIALMCELSGNHALATAGPAIVDAWGTQAAIGNWDTQTAMQAVRDFHTRRPRPVWPNGPDAGQPRHLLPSDITDFIQRARKEPS
ncbi:hypothetical protein [Amycolatopsis thermoflava]|uniref:hypothetical protein n=1 Tax=Amycolatopsis thermoflava TaxID=84480 RepID=UPI0004172BDD|nr:hypothetical protein [Amycolatopsis thermoflava]